MILDTDRISSDGEYRDELRHRCETDHFFLADVIGFDEFDLDWRDPVGSLFRRIETYLSLSSTPKSSECS